MADESINGKNGMNDNGELTDENSVLFPYMSTEQLMQWADELDQFSKNLKEAGEAKGAITMGKRAVFIRRVAAALLNAKEIVDGQ